MADIIAASEEELGLSIPSFPQAIFGLIFGALFIAFSIPHALVRWGEQSGWGWLQGIGSGAAGILDNLSGASPDAQLLSFHSLWFTLLKVVGIYLAALLLLSLRHLRFDLFAAGAISLLVGTAILNLLAWTLYILIVVVSFIFFVLAAILGFLGFILIKVLTFLVFIAVEIGRFLGFIFGELAQFFGFLFHSFWWVVALVAVVAIVSLALRYHSQILTALTWLLRICAYIVVVFLTFKLFQLLAPVFAFLFSVLGRFFAFLGALLAPVFRFIGMLFGFLFSLVVILATVFLAGFLVYGIGAWVMDLFRGAWTSGNGRRGVIIGSLSIGTALAIVLLESNLYHFAAFPYYPVQVATFAATYLHHTAPIFDLVMALVVVAVAVLGVLRNIPRLLKEPSWAEFQSAMVMAVAGIIIGVVLIAISGASDSN